MKISSYIFHYNRPDLAERSGKELSRIGSVTIVDDCSRVKPKGVRIISPEEHNGKEGFYKNWQIAFNDAKESDAEVFIFTADDLLQWRITEVKRWIPKFLDHNMVINFLRDHRDSSWNGWEPKPFNKNFRQIFFVDCAVIIPRSVLELMEWKVTPTPRDFQMRSSGVGYFMTIWLNENEIPILQPVRSWVKHHGNERSVMHKGKRNFKTR